MGVRLIAKDVDAEAFATEYAAPVRRGLELVHFLNESIAKASRNYAPGKGPGVVVGAPTMSASDGLFRSGTNYLVTSMSEPVAGTFFIITKSPDDNSSASTRPGYFGTYRSPKISDPATLGNGIGLYSIGSTVRAAMGIVVDSVDTSSEVATAPSAFATWGLHVVQVRANGKISGRNATTGIAYTEGAFTLTGPRVQTSGKILVGAIPTFAGQAGQSNIAVFQAHSVELTEAEILTTIADLRAYAARRGIAV
jgi:hypothetical protein